MGENSGWERIVGGKASVDDREKDSVRKHYNVDHWSEGYFKINESGSLQAQFTEHGQALSSSLTSVVEQAQLHGAKLPLLVRFKPILRHRVERLKQAFASALSDQQCAVDFLPVYPVKVNQHKVVVEEILALNEVDQSPTAKCGPGTGLEVGSKAELMLAITQGAKIKQRKGADLTIICNGFKDRDYIRLALMAQRCGLKPFIVIEKYAELELIIALAAELSVEPLLGVRVRLNTLGKSNWQNSGGEKSKFGVTAAELLKVTEALAASGLSACLQLLHFHLGSQISHIGDIQAGLKEAARYYAELVGMGLPIHWLDVGGGLGVDYEGSRTRNYCSMNYSLSEYAHTVVQTVNEICEQYKVKFPQLITEAGRAMSAHHAVLITEVVGSEQMSGLNVQQKTDLGPMSARLFKAYEKILLAGQFELLELYHQVCGDYQDIQMKFLHGLIGLDEKASAETLYGHCCVALIQRLDSGSKSREEARGELLKKTPHKTLLNFSLFRSLPDVWGIDQIFPMVPLENLHDALTEQSILQDITCDSDGRIDQYIEGENIQATFSVASANVRPHSLVGFFLVGAYQEILGDNHNLFGKTDTVTVDYAADGTVMLSDFASGDTVQSVLEDVNYDACEILGQLEFLMAELPEALRQDYIAGFKDSLRSGTYLKP